jgi:tRNA (guanine-N7-)-methyltransferase
LPNIAFVRSHIDKITDYFVPGEVSEIWITFPDPQLRGSRAKEKIDASKISPPVPTGAERKWFDPFKNR